MMTESPANITTDTRAVPALTREAGETPEAARRQIARHAEAFAALGARLRRAPPRYVVTCARGSSDHAATYGKFLIETTLGMPVTSVGPGIASVYDAPLDLRDALFITVSQSGRSPDLLSLTEKARAGGALVLGFVNDETSPLAALCDISLPLTAGPEVSVAATKSHILSALAFLSLTAHWSQSAPLKAAIDALPDALTASRALDWSPALQSLLLAPGLFVVGRGPGLGIAQEIALKFKETCCLHGEAFSIAEVIHGPLTMIGPRLPVLALGQEDASAESTRRAVARIAGQGGLVWSVLNAPGARPLPIVPGLPPEIAPLCQIQSFYMAVAGLAQARGFNPDVPNHLAKVTETV
ncbi:MAG: SIS domain-containing protein [Azospirillaceae bacterium]|nr:SIS domain-containing protein [Azospirillaceae bacterium]